MKKIDVSGLQVDATNRQELLDEVGRRIMAGRKTWLTTLYSEFLYAALHDRETLEMLNQADIAVADGVGVTWAAKYLHMPLTASGYWTKILQALWQAVYSNAMILLYPRWIKTIIPEKIVGADLVWDLTKLAADNNLSVYFLGGFGDTPEKAALALSAEHLAFKIAGCSNKNPDDPTIIEDIKKASPDLLLVAYGPIKQEKWIIQNLPNLPVKLAIGLGGTFDYLAGKRPNPPKFVRYMGLEWLFRLLTQPKRIKRIFKATFGLVWTLVKYKIFSSLPYRQNVMSVVLNEKDEIFIGRFNPEKEVVKAMGYRKTKRFDNYWQLPQGGLESGESPEECAKRELWEETAMRSIKLIKVSEKKHSYLWKNMVQRPIWINRRYQYKGQEQRIVYFRFTGPGKEIVLDWDELIEYKWVPWQDLEKELHEDKKSAAKIILLDLKEMREKGIISY